MVKPMKITIIIPAYQSEKTIGKVLRRLGQLTIKGITKEVIVVDDASTDETREKVKSFPWVRLIRHAVNTGKGGAVRTGVSHATGDIMCILDDDLEYDPLDISKLVAPILTKRAQVVFGSRHLDSTNRYSSLPYYLGGKFVDMIIRMVTRFRTGRARTGRERTSSGITRSASLGCCLPVPADRAPESFIKANLGLPT